MNDSAASFDFPPDLERHIFELAAFSFPGQAVKLATLSREIRAWMERLLYGTVVLDSLKDSALFIRTLLEDKPPTFFATHVKNLYITSFVSDQHAQRIISVCTGVSSLVYWSRAPVDLPRDTIHRLSINGTGLVSHQRASLTHLDIVDPTPSTDMAVVFALPRLTHLSIGELRSDWILPTLNEVLAQCVELKSLVIISGDLIISSADSALLDDPRVSVKVKPYYHHPKDYRTYWDDIRRGRADVWPM
ncbi:hypothetical protein CPB85DRAFT_1440033 [Mucidula mucida]|nr:hypothetical protein CPB85DRAFT_1440033 [Mucidula mucida]